MPKNMQQLLLEMGEMTAQERRNVTAALNLAAFKLRRLKATPSDAGLKSPEGDERPTEHADVSLTQEIESLRASLANEKEANQWKLISEAPRDGRRLILWLADEQF